MMSSPWSAAFQSGSLEPLWKAALPAGITICGSYNGRYIKIWRSLERLLCDIAKHSRRRVNCSGEIAYKPSCNVTGL